MSKSLKIVLITVGVITAILVPAMVYIYYGTQEDTYEFPADFVFGAATAAYQIEGAWNVSKKGESIWDRMTHNMTHKIADKSTGDFADNSFYLYKEDIKLVEQMGASAYRISVSWPRILTTGFNNSVDPEGIAYYNNVINEMLGRNITPVVTIYHWDLPQNLQDLGGWENPKIADWFVDYARIVFNSFGDRVKLWITLNEPNIFCIYGYNGLFAPALNKSGRGEYTCGHYALLAHAKAYKMYQEEFFEKQKGKVGITLSASWPVPENPDDPEEVEGARLSWDFFNSWHLNPIFSKTGDYPKSMKERIGNYSRIQGLPKSRLPEFSKEEIELIRNSSDYLGLNFYYAEYEKKLKDYDVKSYVSLDGDKGMTLSSKKFEKDRCTPWAFNEVITRVNEEFDVPEIWIAENGYWDEGGLNDVNRTEFYKLHLEEISKLIQKGVNIRGYFAWSLLDNFEWNEGYTQKYGIVSVNFTDPNRTRTPKLSYKLLTDIYKTKVIPTDFPVSNTV